MKKLSLLIATLAFAVSSAAHAEVITYSGNLRGKEVILTISTQLPSAIQRSVSSPVFDPEYQRKFPGVESITATVGSATLSLNGKQAKSALYANGVAHSAGLDFIYDVVMPSDTGIKLDGSLFKFGSTSSALNEAGTLIEGIEFPANLSVRYYGNGDAGSIEFQKQ